jgi:hypothetical protein
VSNWLIVSESEPRYEVRIGDADQIHAEQVRDDLLSGLHGQHPKDLSLVEVGDDFQPRSLLRRLLG